ncbi:hypothetical protein [Methanomassiliicoccus luminyensis]|uniref:hypothetical protein n=1 Tax=Methanomassiliicoccus luminyensis TaxID=1080712 RepID=UPI0003660A93|nr:hypothetical protein [Methanomassiliicoccus luminyensis]
MDGRTWTIEGICKENGKSIGPLVRLTIECDETVENYVWDSLQDGAEQLFDNFIKGLRNPMVMNVDRAPAERRETPKRKAQVDIAEATKA